MHPHMALSIDECIEHSHLKEKVTAIIPTSQSDINYLMWSVFSLLLRSKPNGMLEHFCVCVNGPDSRTGDPSIQDKKQAFLEDLRDTGWYHVDNPENRCQMPVTVIRAWSRVGWGEALEMALPWVHTDAYLLMHDDVMVLDTKWDETIKNSFYKDDNCAIVYVPPLIGCYCDHAIHRGMYLLRIPQLETTFLFCKKKWMMKAGASWVGYHIPSDDNVLQFDILEDIGDFEEFARYYKEKGLMPKPLLTTELYNFVRQEIGAWVYFKLTQNGHTFSELDTNMILHFEGMSRWEPHLQEEKEIRREKYRKEINALEREIENHPEYSKIYNKYKKEEKHD